MAFSLCCLTLIFYTSVEIVFSSNVRDNFYNELRSLLSIQPFPEEEIHERPVEVPNWGNNLKNLGQVSGISVNPSGQPVIFHRGSRVWDSKSFNSTHHFQNTEEGPIPVPTVLTLDPNTGAVISKWGENKFYLPHGITIDHRNNTWVTDVAMHQVLKFPPKWNTPTLRIGELFTPGHDETKLCKPTSVAIALTGEIFVADGYCNNRILKFKRNGILVRIFPQYEEFLSLVVPHSLALIDALDLLCVADRENMRVACFNAELLNNDIPQKSALSPFTIHQPDLGRVFGIAAKGNIVYAVNGPTSSHIPIQGFTIDPVSETIIDHWMPRNNVFISPHDISISPAGDALYISEIGPNKVWKFSFNPI